MPDDVEPIALSPAVRLAGLAGLLGLGASVLLVMLGVLVLAVFVGLAALANTLDGHHALADDAFGVGAIIALVLAGALLVAIASSPHRRWIAAATTGLSALGLVGASAASSPTAFATAALAFVVCVAVATAIFGALAVGGAARVAHSAVTTSHFWAGCSVASGLLLPLLVLPITITAALTAFGTAFVIVTTVDFPAPSGPTATSVAVLRWFADVASTPSTEDDVAQEKWALAGVATDGAGENDNTSVTCFAVLSTPRLYAGKRSVPFQEAIKSLQKRGLSPDDANDAVTQALLDVCTTAGAPTDADDLRRYFWRAMENKARDLFRVPDTQPVDDDAVACPAVPVDELIGTREFARIMASARASLSARENQALTLYADEMSLAEIAWKLRVSKSEARREFQRALGRLCRIMAARGCPVRCGSAQVGVTP